MKKILILSDIHGNIKTMEKILNDHKDCYMKIFLGDLELFSKSKHIEQLKKFDKSVTGNCDIPNLSPMYDFLIFDNIKILIVHGHMFSTLLHKIDFEKMYKFGLENNVDAILHGHDHIAENINKNEIIRFNPGSITHPKGGKKPSYGILKINNDGTFELKHYFLDWI